MELSIEQYEKINPIASCTLGKQQLKYAIPNTMTKWRVDSLMTKEPHTIKWIETFKPTEILFDVGANVGMYTILAAKTRGVKVYAFEPESQNYALLNKNIYINQLNNQVTAYCMGLSDHNGYEQLNLSQFSLGGSCHSVGEEVGFDLKPRAAAFKQGCLVGNIDEMVREKIIPIPQHIKIDVDGFEHKVIQGAAMTLANPKVKTLLIEINPHLAEHQNLLKFLTTLGFKYDQKQADDAARTSGPFKGVGEYIFQRETQPQKINSPWHKPTTASPGIVTYTSKEKAIKNHILSQINKVKVSQTPTPYCYIKNIFPEDYYQEILANFPNKKNMIPLNETGRASYKDRYVVLMNDEDLAKLPKTQKQFWQECTSWLYSPEFTNAMIEKFENPLLKRFKQKTLNLKITGDGLITNDQTNYSISPHTDVEPRIFSALFYCPKDDSQKHLGTSLYKPKKLNFKSDGSKHLPLEDFTKIKTMNFLPNTLFAFPRTDQSFHGVEKIIEPNSERQSIIFNARQLGETE